MGFAAREDKGTILSKAVGKFLYETTPTGEPFIASEPDRPVAEIKAHIERKVEEKISNQLSGDATVKPTALLKRSSNHDTLTLMQTLTSADAGELSDALKSFIQLLEAIAKNPQAVKIDKVKPLLKEDGEALFLGMAEYLREEKAKWEGRINDAAWASQANLIPHQIQAMQDMGEAVKASHEQYLKIVIGQDKQSSAGDISH